VSRLSAGGGSPAVSAAYGNTIPDSTLGSVAPPKDLLGLSSSMPIAVTALARGVVERLAMATGTDPAGIVRGIGLASIQVFLPPEDS
jgi:hypothetical protein